MNVSIYLGRGYNIQLNPDKMTAVPPPPPKPPGCGDMDGGLPSINVVSFFPTKMCIKFAAPNFHQ